MQPTIPLEPGQYYHIFNRGNNGANIFIDERNYTYFMNLYVKHITPVADTFAYCLLRNHFHVGVRIKDDPGPKDPGQQFSNFFNAYSKGLNHVYRRTGSVFENRYRRKVITTERYFLRVIHYIHWNPQKHGFVTDYRDYPYSSYRLFLMNQPTFLKRSEVLAWFGGQDGFIQQHLALTDEKDTHAWLIEEED